MRSPPTSRRTGCPPWRRPASTRDRPTLWIAEALTFFLTAEQAAVLLRLLAEASAPGSRLALDFLGRALLNSPFAKPFLDSLAEDGTPWIFGTDEPEEFLDRERLEDHRPARAQASPAPGRAAGRTRSSRGTAARQPAVADPRRDSDGLMSRPTADRRITLERIESFLPERSVRIEELGGHLGLRRAELGVFRKFYGLDTLRFDPELSLLDLLRPAARGALAALPAGGQVDYLAYAHTTQAVAPADVDVAQLVKDDLGLTDAEAFGLSHQACVSSLGAIEVLGELLRAEGGEGAYALMVTGEKAYSPIVQHVPNTAIMADAAAACLVTIGGVGDVVRSFATRTLGEYAQWMELTQRAEHRVRGEVRAAGSPTSSTRPWRTPGLTLDEVDLVIPHNVNMLSWRQSIKELGITPDKVFLDNIARYSHTFASDVFVNYTTLREAGRLVDGAHYLLVSVGLGATFGAMVITHRAAGEA